MERPSRAVIFAQGLLRKRAVLLGLQEIVASHPKPSMASRDTVEQHMPCLLQLSQVTFGLGDWVLDLTSHNAGLEGSASDGIALILDGSVFDKIGFTSAETRPGDVLGFCGLNCARLCALLHARAPRGPSTCMLTRASTDRASWQVSFAMLFAPLAVRVSDRGFYSLVLTYPWDFISDRVGEACCC